MNKLLYLLSVAALCMSGPSIAAAEAETAAEAEQPRFSIKPTARLLADGAVYAPDGQGFTDGVTLSDIAVGVTAGYGKWSGRVDLGFGYFKFAMKDVYVQYKFNDRHLLRLGYFIQQFGLQAAYSKSMKPTFETPVSDSYMGATPRELGLMYNMSLPCYFMGLSATFGTIGDLSAEKVTRPQIGTLGRFVWRPVAREGAVAQVGVSAWYQSPLYKRSNEDGKGSFNFSANYPTRVAKVKMLGATLQHAGNQLLVTPELLLSYKRFALQSQYYYMNVRRHRGLPAYEAQGAYVWLHCLLLGDSSYKYAPSVAGLATPGPKTLEVVAGYDYTNGSHKDVHGGISNDVHVSFNYYINKYLLARLGWRYAMARDSQALMADFGGRHHVNIIQARIQFRF